MFNNLLLDIDAGTIDWSRAQFALTAIYHWLFVPLTLGLAVIMGIVETIYYRTKEQFWKDAAVFWQFGAPLAVEGIVAFFMESTFVAVMYFGWKKVSPGFHLASTWLTGLGATISAWWILVANAWMQYPVGCAFNPDTMRNEMVSFFEVALSPFAVSKFCHTVTSAWIIGAVFCVGVCSWYMMKRREPRLSIESMKIGAAVGLVASLLAAATGHKSAQDVAAVQPMKLAAMEALYDGGNGIGLKVIEGIEVPYALSFMATNDFEGYVPGVNNILNGYTTPDGKVEPSVDEKIERGKKAIAALAAYRKGKKEGAEDTLLNKQLSILNENMPYFGYGYIRDKSEVVPPIAVNFWAFRIMVGAGCLFILFFAVVLAGAYGWPKQLWRDRSITGLPKWHYWIAIALIPLAYIASESGWLVAEFGRQPWTIQDMLPTWAAVSDLQSSSVMITFFLFLILFTTMLAVEINIMLKQIKKGPQL